jgi:hypothetical protein
MSSNAKHTQAGNRQSRDGDGGAVRTSEGLAVKTAKPVSATPDLDDFVADLLVTDKIILDHLAK